MRFRKKKLLFFLIFTLSVFAFFALLSFAQQNLGGFAFPSSPLAANFEAFAQDLEVEYPTIPGAPLSAQPTLPEYIRYLYNFSITIAGLVALFSLVYGGFRYLASVGSPVAMADAKDQITAGIVGLIILLGSYMFLTIVNPELAILKLDKTAFTANCGNNICEPGETITSCPADCQITRVTLTSDLYRVYELPIGRLIENALEPVRLNTISVIANRISNDSGILKNKAEEFWNLLNQCSCNNTNPTFSCVSSGLGQACPAPLPPPTAQCDGGDPCPDRAGIIAAKNALPGLADNLATTMETMLPPLTSLKKDEQRLEIAAEILKETISPTNYDNLLEIKQVIMDAGGEVGIVPFTVLARTIRGRGDPATFYVDEKDVTEMLQSGVFPVFPRFNTLAVCDECEIDIHYSSPELVAFLKSRKAEFAAIYPSGKITDPCPGGFECWDYVIQWAKTNGWNPAFLLALWGEESRFSETTIALGCDPFRINQGTSPYTGNIAGPNSQLECFADTTDPATGNCGPAACSTGNTPLCSFMRCWSGGNNSCTLSNNPNFWPNLFSIYESLIPSEIDPVDNPAAPSGNCTTTASGFLPPELAGCPLDPTEPGFGITCGWEGYVGHRGIDINAADGEPVYAIADGTIFATGSNADGCGIQIWLDTGGFGVFRYCHLLNTVIPLGTNIGVVEGERIGRADTTGTAITGPHLHFEYRPDGINPYPVECLGVECISTAPDLRAGICTNGPVSCP